MAMVEVVSTRGTPPRCLWYSPWGEHPAGGSYAAGVMPERL